MKKLKVAANARSAFTAGLHVIHFRDFIHGREEQSAPGALALLTPHQKRRSARDFRVFLESPGPVKQVPVVWAGVASDLRVTLDGGACV